VLEITCPSVNEAERRYVLDVVLRQWFGLDYVLVLQPDAEATTLRLRGQEAELQLLDVVLSVDLAELTSLPVATGSGWAAGCEWTAGGSRPNDRVPVLYGDTPSVAAQRLGTGATIDIDVFGTVFALLVGLEDRFISERDDHGRVPMTSSLIHRRGLVERPVVDELTEFLWDVFTTLWPRLERRRRQSTVRLTQDVDRMGKFGRATMGDLAMATVSGLRRGPTDALDALRRGLAVRAAGPGSDPYYTFDEFMTLAEKHGRQAEFYFITRFRPPDGTRLASYELTEPVVRALVRQIGERGHGLGVHPSYNSHLDVEALRADADALRAVASDEGVELETLGGRHHYLRWDSHRSPGCWQAAGLAHDSSVGFAESYGFRAGTSKPFPLWDHQTRTATEVEERPLIYMDATLSSMGLTFESEGVVERLLGLKALCERYDGDFTFLVHNGDFALPGAHELLEALIS